MAECDASAEEAYSNLRRLIPQLAEELDSLRASLREHNVWLQRYGSAPEAPHAAFSSVSPYNPASTASATTESGVSSTSRSSSKSPPNYLASSTSNNEPQTSADNSSDLPPPRYPTSSSTTTTPPPLFTATPNNDSLPIGSSSSTVPAIPQPPTYPSIRSSNSEARATSPPLDNDIPPSYGNTSPPPPPFLPPPPTREEMAERRDQTAEWLREGEDVLREYSARFAQLGTELQRPFEDVLGTWESSHPDNALPDYERVEEREELMVGGVGEVPPPYVGGASEARGIAQQEALREYGDERDVINETRRRQAIANGEEGPRSSDTPVVEVA